MPCYVDYECRKCKYKINKFYIKSLSQVPKHIICPMCGKVAYKIIGMPQIIIKENNLLGKSTKPSRYWHNAEQCRLGAVKKRNKIKKEKKFYEEKK